MDNKKLRRQKINVMLNEEERKIITEKAIKYGYGDCLAEYIRAACIYENIYVEAIEGKNEICAAVSRCIELLGDILSEQKKLLKNPIISEESITKIFKQNKIIIEEIDSLQKLIITTLSVNIEKKIQHRNKMIDTHRADVKLFERVIDKNPKITILRPSNLKAPAKKFGYAVFIKMFNYTFNLNNFKLEDFTGLVNMLRDIAMKKNLLMCFCRTNDDLRFGIIMDFTDYESAEKFARKENEDLYSLVDKDGRLVGDIYSSNG